jgi:hypothetical protein
MLAVASTERNLPSKTIVAFINHVLPIHILELHPKSALEGIWLHVLGNRECVSDTLYMKYDQTVENLLSDPLVVFKERKITKSEVMKMLTH